MTGRGCWPLDTLASLAKAPAGTPSGQISRQGVTVMGFLNDARKKLEDAVDKHGDKIGQGLDKAAAMVDKKTDGKYAEKISSGLGKAKVALDDLDGKKDDIPTSSTPAPPADPDNDPSHPTGPTGPADPTEPTDPSEPTAPTGPMGSGVPGGGANRPEADPSSPAGSGGGENADQEPVPTDPAPVPPEPGADPAEDRLSAGGQAWRAPAPF